MQNDEGQIRQLVATWMSATRSGDVDGEGHTLTILKKEHGKWLLARDANLLSSVQRPQT